MVFGGKTEGIVCGKGVVRDSGGRDGTGDGAKGGVVVVRRDAIARFKVDEFRHILIAIAGVEELAITASSGEERPRRDGFRRVPNKEVYLRIIVSEAMVFSHAKPLRQFCLC